MIVTGIEEVSKSRSKICIDGEFAFVLYKGELRHFHLREGEEISTADHEQIMKEILPKRAKLRAMNLLLKKNYTNAQLSAKLKEGGYPEEIVQYALDYVGSFHYVDDLRYAIDYIICHEKNRSRARIEQDLRAKGIDKEVMAQAFRQWEEEGGGQDEEQMILALFKKRGFDPETATPSQRQREYGFLMRKGYSPERVRSAVFGHFTEGFD